MHTMYCENVTEGIKTHGHALRSALKLTAACILYLYMLHHASMVARQAFTVGHAENISHPDTL